MPEETQVPTPTVSEVVAVPRDTVVTFTQQHASYFEGEVAGFTPDEAAALIERGVAVAGDASTSAPVNVDVPHVSQAGAVLTCTMGNWLGAPTAYAYQWRGDAADIGAGGDTYTVTPGDAGTTITCVVTATNANGSTAAPPSNGIAIAAEVATESTHADHRRRGR
jgi:hypothetical protein